MPPAILAGWIDRILAPGVAYKLSGGAAGTSAPSLNADALVVTTGDTDADREALVFGDPLSLIWERCVLPYVGAARATRTQVSPVNAMSAQQRHAALDDVAVRTLTLLEDRAARSRA
jgi:putative NADPH-quinone reductase